jgi:RND family efflux transporter MFP subunit
LEGLTRPSKQVELALRVPGILARRPIEEGQQVKAGQLIGELNSKLEEATVRISRLKAESEYEIRAAEATETMKREELDRQHDLLDKNATSKWELRKAELAHQLAKVEAEAARFQQELAKELAKRDEVLLVERQFTAPFAGWIWRTFKEEGEAVDKLEPIAVLVQLNPLWVELNVPAARFGRILPGQSATVTVGKESRGAKVIGIDPLVDAGSSTFRVKVELNNADGTFVAGVPASVRFEPADPLAHEHETKRKSNDS